MAAMAGKQLVVAYDATLTKAAAPEKGLTNAAAFTVDQEVVTTEGDGLKIYTGGATFVKVDKQSQARLAGAVWWYKKQHTV